jgi:hypothetical protein
LLARWVQNKGDQAIAGSASVWKLHRISNQVGRRCRPAQPHNV